MSNIEQVIRQLRAAQHLIGRALDQANEARTAVERATSNLRHVLGGAGTPDAQLAPQRWEVARERLDRMVGRLLSGDRTIDAYIEHIAPGSGARASTTSRLALSPSGGEERRGALDGLSHLMARKADEAQDLATNVTSLVHRGFALGRTGSATQSRSPAAQPRTGPPPNPADVVGNLTVLAAMTWIGVRRLFRSDRLRSSLRRRGTENG